MMDCKELIKHLKNIRFLYADDGMQCASVCKDAATAIETLLAERDAAVEELRGMCWCCTNGKWLDKAPRENKTATCEYMREMGMVSRFGGKRKCPHWEWRGPKGLGTGGKLTE